MRTRWWAGILFLTASPAAAQVVVTGKIVDDSTRSPISGVEVIIEGPGSHKGVTDADGVFIVAGMPLGIGSAIVRKIGYRPVRLRTLAFADDTVEVTVRLSRAVVELEPLEVRATSLPPGMEDYAQRRFVGLGKYLDPELLRRSESRRVSDLLRNITGVQLRPVGGSRYIAVSSRGNCVMSVWVDGVQTYSPSRRSPPVDIDMIPVSQLEAVEVYRGAAETPPELSGGGTGCGVIVLWTRRR